MFGLLHFPSHPDAVVEMLPYYLAVFTATIALVFLTVTFVVLCLGLRRLHPARS
jgi:hypothetical protein